MEESRGKQPIPLTIGNQRVAQTSEREEGLQSGIQAFHRRCRKDELANINTDQGREECVGQERRDGSAREDGRFRRRLGPRRAQKLFDEGAAHQSAVEGKVRPNR
jgi:hypothetical protein